MLNGDRTRRMAVMIGTACMSCALSLGMSGCHHKPVVPPLPAITQPVALETPPPPAKPPMIEAQPVRMPPVPVAAAGGKVRTHRKNGKTSPSTAATPPVQVASVETTPPPEQTAIGALSTGGDASPQAQKDATDLIASIDKRLNALSAQKAEAEKAQISKIRNFQRQAQEALSSGDAEGAKTLATKAKLLLDDIEK